MRTTGNARRSLSPGQTISRVILCGLTTSTLLNMIVVPTRYLRYGQRTRRNREY